MWRERVIEEKKRLNLSTRTLSDVSRLHLPEETINRVLNGKTASPGIDTVLDIMESVGMQPYEAFMDSTTAAEFKAYLALKAKQEESEADRIRIVAENEKLKETNSGLADKIRVFEMTTAHLEEVMKLKDELIRSKDELILSYKINKPLYFK